MREDRRKKKEGKDEKDGSKEAVGLGRTRVERGGGVRLGVTTFHGIDTGPQQYSACF